MQGLLVILLKPQNSTFLRVNSECPQTNASLTISKLKSIIEKQQQRSHRYFKLPNKKGLLRHPSR